MAIKYLHFTIDKVIHPETKEEVLSLSHWYYSSEMPHVALRMHEGFFKTYDEADVAHHRRMFEIKAEEFEDVDSV